MLENPLVTVVMAVYNGKKYLNPTIKSILKQTFTDFEFIIVNDASNDLTPEILGHYKDPRIRVYNNNINLGQTKSLNIGLKLAQGKYIARTDAGDVSLPNRLKEQVEYMMENPQITAVGTSAFRYSEENKLIDIVRMPTSPDRIIQRIFFTTPLVHISVLMNRKTILDLGGYDENYQVLADYDLWLRLLANKLHLANLRSVHVGYMISPQSVGAKNLYNKSSLEASTIIQKAVKTLLNSPVSLEAASSIFRLSNYDMEFVSFDEIRTVNKLLGEIFKEKKMLSKEIDYAIFKKSISYIFFKSWKIKDREKCLSVIKSIFKNTKIKVVLRLFGDYIFRKLQMLIWKIKKGRYILSIFCLNRTTFAIWDASNINE